MEKLPTLPEGSGLVVRLDAEALTGMHAAEPLLELRTDLVRQDVTSWQSGSWLRPWIEGEIHERFRYLAEPAAADKGLASSGMAITSPVLVVRPGTCIISWRRRKGRRPRGDESEAVCRIANLSCSFVCEHSAPIGFDLAKKRSQIDDLDQGNLADIW